MADVELVRAAALAGVPHGFATRRGGVSTGILAGLNCGLGAGDAPGAAEQNRRLATEAVLPGGRLVSVHQIHSTQAVIVDDPWSEHARPHADALVTDRPGIVLGVVTADCAPVLLAEVEAGVVGAAHAGWRGAQAGIVGTCVAAMESLGARPQRIVAAVGPCIAQASYQVDEALHSRFEPPDERFFIYESAEHWRFDLEGYVAERLAQAGVGQIDKLGLDTYADEARFYSFRRATHRGEPDYGRQISLIALPEER